MKLFAILALVFSFAAAEDHMRLLYNPPVVKFPGIARIPAVLDKLPKKVIDPTALIRVSAPRHKVKSALVKSIVAAEAACNANAGSPRGAIVLMQLMPSTPKQCGADDPLTVAQN